MLPTESVYGVWPNSGEIDIMEHVGYDQNNVHFTLHANAFYGANGKGGAKIISTASDEFHVYRLDWAPYGIRGYFDNEKSSPDTSDTRPDGLDRRLFSELC